MLYLLEITYTNDKESAAIYDNFANETALTAEFDTKMGAAMKAEAYKAELLVAFAQTGQIISQGYHSKDDTIELKPRLVTVTAKASGETANQSSYANLEALEADFYSKRGSAKKNNEVLAFTQLKSNGKGIYATDYWARPSEPTSE